MARGNEKKTLKQPSEGTRALGSILGTLAVGNPAAAAGLAGLVEGARYLGAKSSGGPMPPTAATAPVAAPRTRAARQPTIADPTISGLRALLAAGGGGISLNQLASLSGSMGNLAATTAKAPTSAKDVMGMEYLNAAKLDMAEKVATARTLPTGGVEEERSAVREYMQRLALFSGGDLGVMGFGDK